MENLPAIVISVATFFFLLISVQPVAEYLIAVASKRVKDAQKKYIINDKSYLFESEIK